MTRGMTDERAADIIMTDLEKIKAMSSEDVYRAYGCRVGALVQALSNAPSWWRMRPTKEVLLKLAEKRRDHVNGLRRRREVAVRQQTTLDEFSTDSLGQDGKDPAPIFSHADNGGSNAPITEPPSPEEDVCERCCAWCTPSCFCECHEIEEE